MPTPEQQALSLRRVVHKIGLPGEVASEQGAVLDLPEDAEILHFALQRSTFCIWYVTRQHQSGRTKSACFVLRGTGHPLPPETIDRYQHVASCFTDQSGTYVFHLFRMDQ